MGVRDENHERAFQQRRATLWKRLPAPMRDGKKRGGKWWKRGSDYIRQVYLSFLKATLDLSDVRHDQYHRTAGQQHKEVQSKRNQVTVSPEHNV